MVTSIGGGIITWSWDQQIHIPALSHTLKCKEKTERELTSFH
nr:MAG TPA: hypothetical protein [Caudoviricetes sp.]